MEKKSKKKSNALWESFIVSKENDDADEEWEGVEFLDSFAAEEIKQRCYDTFPPDKIDEFENYTILEELGRGRMGIVYKAVHNTTKKLYALKILPENVLHDPKAVNRFFQEICIHHSLNHDNIIKLHKIGLCKETVFIVMEYVAGKGLDSYLAKNAPLNEFEALNFIIPILEALEHAHSLQIVHRDLKPANILVEEITKAPKIADFGLARLTSGNYADDEGFGTPAYMAPEQIITGREVDIRADIYAVGSIFYHMLCGNRPYYHIESPKLLLETKTKSDPQNIEELVANLHPRVSMLVQIALRRDVKSRYQKPEYFLADARDSLEEIKKIRSRQRIPLAAVEELHKTSTSTAYSPTGDDLLMTCSRYEVDEVLSTFQRALANFNNSPVGSAMVEESQSGDMEFEETLLSISMVPDAAVNISLDEEKIVNQAYGKDLMAAVMNVLKTTKLTAAQKNTFTELKYLLLLRGNFLTKRQTVLEIINQGTRYLDKKLDELSWITQRVAFNKKIRKYFQQLVGSVLRKYDQVFIGELKLCRDYDELECYLENYPLQEKTALKAYKNLQLISKVKIIKKKAAQAPKQFPKLLDKYLGRKPTTVHELLKKLYHTRKEENSLWRMIGRSRNLNEFVAHLARFEQKSEFRTIASRIHELINVFIGAGGQMSLKQLKTSLNFIPQRECGRICLLVKKKLRTELQEKIQELLKFEGDEPKRFKALMALLRNPRYHQDITLYGFDVKDLAGKISELRAQPDDTQLEPLKDKLPDQLLALLYKDVEAESARGVKNVNNCVARLNKLHKALKAGKKINILRRLVDAFKIYGKINLAKEDSIYAVDGYQLARIIIKYYNDNCKGELALPANLRKEVAIPLQALIAIDTRRQVKRGDNSQDPP